MTKFVPVSKDTHSTKTWLSTGKYNFAKTSSVASITAEELVRASRTMPCAFTRTDGHINLCVVLGLQPNMNLFVAPDARWIGEYTPALFRAHPFRLARMQGQDSLALVVDEEDGLPSDGEPFYDAEGKPAPKLSQFIEFLTLIEQGRQKTNEVVQQLDDAGLIEEWPLTVKSKDGNEQKINGLFRVSEKRLNLLDDEAFLNLRRSAALPLAYMQLLSMRNIDLLGKLAEAQIEIAQQQAQHEDSIFELPEDNEISIDWKQFDA